MTEDDARAATHAIVGQAAFDRLAGFADRVLVESKRQNLVAKPTLGSIWQRHLLDAAQLVPLAEAHPGLWIDVGTGAGFPGMVVALATERPMILVEPRRLRADFLEYMLATNGIASRVTIARCRVERLPTAKTAVISARAVAAFETLLAVTAHVAQATTLYLLPKGQSATTEVAKARGRFEGLFHVERSITDPASGIITATSVRARR